MTYELCGQPECWHFIEENSALGDSPGLAEYVHLDDGGKEHDHDAQPSGVVHPLDFWRYYHPALFTCYPDGKYGPNSQHFKGGSA